MAPKDSTTSNGKSAWKTINPFLYGGLSGMAATTTIQPIDMIKVRIQLAAKNSISNPLQIAKNIISNEGVAALYKGLSAGLLRQATYTTARMGLFNNFITKSKEYNNGAPVSFAQRAIAGLAAGGLGALIGNPADLALIRMQADFLKPISERKNYTNVFNALFRITKSEGLPSLWNGSAPTVARAMALNLGMLSTYAEAKSQLEANIGVNAWSKLGASGIAGFFASAFSLPFDFVKTRLQMGGSRGVWEVVRGVVRDEGVGAFYKGFGTFYFRIAPHAMITLLVAEYLQVLDGKYFAKAVVVQKQEQRL